MSVSVHTHTHTNTCNESRDRQYTGMGLAPKAWSELKYQECAGQYSLSFLIQTGGRSEETRDLWGEMKRITMMLMLRNHTVVLQEQSVGSLPVELGNKPARVCAISWSHVFAYVHTNTCVLLVLAYITAVKISKVFRSQQHVESIEVHSCNYPAILKINPWQMHCNSAVLLKLHSYSCKTVSTVI